MTDIEEHNVAGPYVAMYGAALVYSYSVHVSAGEL